MNSEDDWLKIEMGGMSQRPEKKVKITQQIVSIQHFFNDQVLQFRFRFRVCFLTTQSNIMSFKSPFIASHNRRIRSLQRTENSHQNTKQVYSSGKLCQAALMGG